MLISVSDLTSDSSFGGKAVAFAAFNEVYEHNICIGYVRTSLITVSRLESGFGERCCDQTSEQADKRGSRKDASVTKDPNVQEEDRGEKHPSKR